MRTHNYKAPVTLSRHENAKSQAEKIPSWLMTFWPASYHTYFEQKGTIHVVLRPRPSRCRLFHHHPLRISPFQGMLGRIEKEREKALESACNFFCDISQVQIPLRIKYQLSTKTTLDSQIPQPSGTVVAGSIDLLHPTDFEATSL